jgi:hypothetical protein
VIGAAAGDPAPARPEPITFAGGMCALGHLSRIYRASNTSVHGVVADVSVEEQIGRRNASGYDRAASLL